LFGEGFTGLKNIGNSCYLASTLQCLFGLPQFKKRYYFPDGDLPMVEDPAQDLETQLRKIADGLLSGRYSHPDKDIPTHESGTQYQRGLAPSMLKHLIGRGHAEFSTMRQQDAFEFLLHLFKLITRSHNNDSSQDPTNAFRFVIEHRLQCLSCKKVRYRTDEQDNLSIPVPFRKIPKSVDSGEDEYEPVTLKECLDSFTATVIVKPTCSGCGSKEGFSMRSLFKTFPEVLAVNAMRFTLVNWVPTKVNVAVIVGDDSFQLDAYKSAGHQPGEDLLPEEPESSKVCFK